MHMQHQYELHSIQMRPLCQCKGKKFWTIAHCSSNDLSAPSVACYRLVQSDIRILGMNYISLSGVTNMGDRCFNILSHIGQIPNSSQMVIARVNICKAFEIRQITHCPHLFAPRLIHYFELRFSPSVSKSLHNY